MEKLVIPYGMTKEIEIDPPKRDYSIIVKILMILSLALMVIGAIGAMLQALGIISFSR